ncbi:exodeoxyribonuclease V subunit beta [Vibrio sinensis]|uniref:RecBCD enzyme subunit RecB n=1 Tax=Vibrio sinensis TaxID=2302434 RepID=A0A3A6R0K4_9VIBR|nr:exodeoxyribonuclease V subunit beta [Vibrio sinensis]RJX74319.1 exodeoxyribonuclease V subunit beta [Vibrio sinensis]
MTSTSVVTSLDAMTFPLHGARLIEASAGTGKTFTIAGLYLRLLLGHGDSETKHCTPLTVDQILVVTFTEAATAELRDRIRARIHDARIAFARGQSQDPVIKPLLEVVSDHQQAAAILLQAERQMDEAAVYTIHGFCQRMLTQNAFESGSRFNNEFVTDESHLKAQVVADYWRRNFYSLPIKLAGEVRQIWGAPSALLDDVRQYLTGVPVKLSVPAMSGSLQDLHQQNLEKIDQLKQLWRASQDDFLSLIENSDVNKRSYSKKSLPAWLGAVDAWAATETNGYDYPDKLEKFSQSELNSKTTKGTSPQHPVFVAIEEFLAQPISLKAPLLAHAIEQCRDMLAKAKQQKHWLSFDDLLTNLSASMDEDESGLLAETIRHLYPVAMIDEFQDTDPLQYSIFSRIYLNNPECGLFMIGDPKQAIYGFRGADIFTYIKARQQVSSHFTLGTNWRSSADMVSSVNQVFERPSSPFIYDQDIPFLPVAHSPNAEKRTWTMGSQKQPALTYWLQEADDKPLSKGEYLDAMAQACADQIHTILAASQNSDAFFCDGKNEPQAIKAGDIAVLVRTGNEGRMVKEALAKQGIASVYLSNRDSVFTATVAQDIQRLLQAVLIPENDRALRACLASELFALDAGALDALNNDETEWENAVNEFKEYRKLWTLRGVLPMLRAVMSKRHVAERLLEEDLGERVLTDLMHIGELLQQASQELDSDHGLLRWLAQSISDAQQGLGGSDDQIQRLESERNLVQIVTIHKSKGLEYDLVFLPFVLSYREASEAKYYDAESDTTILDLTKQDVAIEQADKERLAEDLRLIYVALTRAVYGCFIGTAPLRNGRSTKEPTGVHQSAMGYLLQDGQAGSISDLTRAIEAQVNGLPCVFMTGLPQEHTDLLQMEQSDAQVLTASELNQEIDRSWRITSYSGLVKQGNQHHSNDALTDIMRLDVDSSDDLDSEELLEPERSIFTFPRGARPGTFLHSLFEEVEFTQPANSEENTQVIVRLMESEQLDEQWLPILQQLIDTVLDTPLDGKSMRLNETQPHQRLVEMEFLLPIEVLASSALNRVTQRHDPLSAKAGDLGFHTVQGMLKGFIDLVFEHQGKYYVLDWKSNHLGDDVHYYHGEALKSAMADHRYDLQYQIYALALHRFLRSRLAHYDYDQHFGGVYYLFLRGMDGESEHGIFSARPTFELLDEMDKLIDGKTIEARESSAGQMELDL